MLMYKTELGLFAIKSKTLKLMFKNNPYLPVKSYI